MFLGIFPIACVKKKEKKRKKMYICIFFGQFSVAGKKRKMKNEKKKCRKLVGLLPNKIVL